MTLKDPPWFFNKARFKNSENKIFPKIMVRKLQNTIETFKSGFLKKLNRISVSGRLLFLRAQTYRKVCQYSEWLKKGRRQLS